MRHSKQNNYFFALGLICLISLFSCRKKDERYEGYYVGEERYAYIDSGATTPSIDSTYVQEIDITYEKAISSKKKIYTFLRVFNNPYSQISQLSQKSFENHEYLSPLGGYVRFSGDSMYMAFSNWTDAEEVWDIETWEFKGKRN
ncbi:MAG: hypothetical protein HYZ14_04030 [Bacteroidetes bacterium]|nr:hypothetical protein [Bacteroidota bacterium]